MDKKLLERLDELAKVLKDLNNKLIDEDIDRSEDEVLKQLSSKEFIDKKQSMQDDLLRKIRSERDNENHFYDSEVQESINDEYFEFWNRKLMGIGEDVELWQLKSCSLEKIPVTVKTSCDSENHEEDTPSVEYFKHKISETEVKEGINLKVELPVKFRFPKGFKDSDFDTLCRNLRVKKGDYVKCIADELVAAFKETMKRSLESMADVD